MEETQDVWVCASFPVTIPARIDLNGEGVKDAIAEYLQAALVTLADMKEWAECSIDDWRKGDDGPFAKFVA